MFNFFLDFDLIYFLQYIELQNYAMTPEFNNIHILNNLCHAVTLFLLLNNYFS